MIYSNTTRFIIVCNNSTKIIEPIQSRCAILRFSKVEDKNISLRLRQVCDMAGFRYKLDGIEALARVADGDVRSALNNLGPTVSAFNEVTSKNVYKTCDTPQPAKVEEILETLRRSTDFVLACRKLKEMCDDGHSPTDVVSTFFKTICTSSDVDEGQRLEIAKAIGWSQASVLNGASTYLQLTDMLWNIAKVFHESG